MSKKSLLFVLIICQIIASCSVRFEEKEPLLIPPSFEKEYKEYKKK